jgi:hypothetical protein
MADPKINRSFTYDSVNEYYKYKIALMNPAASLVLPQVDGNPIYTSLDALCSHLVEVAKTHGIPLDACGSDVNTYTWGEYISAHPVPKQDEIWKFREYVFACSVLFVGALTQRVPENRSFQILESGQAPARYAPSDFAIQEHTFTIVGSAERTSDIDITIQGPCASFLISILEDAYLYMTEAEGVPVRCWDVEFYGDFKILQSVFVNMARFMPHQRLMVLKYAVMSYFRSTHQHARGVTPVLSRVAAFFINSCLTSIKTSVPQKPLSEFVQTVYDEWVTAAPDGHLQREQFYKELQTVEYNSKLVKPYMKTRQEDGKIVSNNAAMAGNMGRDEPAAIAFALFYGIMKGNVHRAESYIVPSTAVHVVEFEQKKGGMYTDVLPEAWLSSNARIGIDAFGFIISAIEQLGYLEHYHPSDVECSKKGVKYFGRFVRALVQAGLLPETTEFVDTYRQLNAFRSSKAPGAVCGFNIHAQLDSIYTAVGGTAVFEGGGGRTWRRRRRTLRLRRRQGATSRSRK